MLAHRMDIPNGGAPTAAVLSGIDLLMNPKKRAGSATSSVRSSGSMDNNIAAVSAPDATVRDLFSQPAYPPPPPPPPLQPQSAQQQQRQPAFFYKKPAPVASSVYSDKSASSSSSSSYDDDDGSDSGSDDDGDDDDDGSSSASGMVVRRLSPEEEANQKRDIMYQFDRIERKGVRLPRRFTMEDPLEEMKAELERVKIDRELDISVRFQRKMLMTCVTGIEMLNGKFDPFDVKLDGWSDAMHEQVGDYDEVFEELHMKYRGKAKMAPELKLMFMVGGSGVMFHLTSSMFRQSSMPGLEQVLRKNPALMRQMAQATMSAMGDEQQQQQQQYAPPPPAARASGGGGLFGSLFSGFMGGGGPMPSGGMPMKPAAGGQFQQQQPPPQQAPSMRGPKQVGDILRDLHRDAFAPQQQQHDYSSRIEIISNASDSELGELPDDAASVLVGPATSVATKGARGGGASRRKGK